MDNIELKIKENIIDLLSTEIEDSSLLSQNEINYTPDIKMGDYAYPCFGLSKSMKKQPNEIANDLENALQPNEIIEKIQAAGPYLNFYINKKYFNNLVFESIQKDVEIQPKGEKIMIEYSGPNPCKAFHMGHVRNTTLGVSIINLYKYAGYEVISANYLNDTGTHIAKVIWLYLRSYQGKEPDYDRGKWLGELYVEANQILDDDDSFLEEVYDMHKKLESKDPQVRELLEKFKKWSLEDFNKIYDQLGATFDTYFYDSDYIDAGKKIVQELLDKGIAKKSQGAIVVDLEKYDLHTVLVLKSDETSLYITKDLAMAKDRFTKFNVDKLIYVVGAEQKLNFNQLFKILELYGFEHAKDCLHLSYELVNAQDGKKMSTRDGTVVLYHELFEQSYKKAYKETQNRHPEWNDEQLSKISESIAIAAIKFDMLKYDANKTINFDVDAALDLKGDTGPYILYTVARINSLLNKLDDSQGDFDVGLLKEKEEQSLILHLSKLYSTFDQAAILNKPSAIAHYCLELAHLFNQFYHAYSILDTKDKDLAMARIGLVKVSLKAFSKALDMIGIRYIEKM